MKNQNYYVLKTVYNLSKRNNVDFVPLNSLRSKNCPENVITHLEFRHYLNYKRENQEDFYSITLKGIEYLCQQQRDNFNVAMTVIAAVASIIGIIIAILELCQV